MGFAHHAKHSSPETGRVWLYAQGIVTLIVLRCSTHEFILAAFAEFLQTKNIVQKWPHVKHGNMHRNAQKKCFQAFLGFRAWVHCHFPVYHCNKQKKMYSEKSLLNKTYANAGTMSCNTAVWRCDMLAPSCISGKHS